MPAGFGSLPLLVLSERLTAIADAPRSPVRTNTGSGRARRGVIALTTEQQRPRSACGLLSFVHRERAKGRRKLLALGPLSRLRPGVQAVPGPL